MSVQTPVPARTAPPAPTPNAKGANLLLVAIFGGMFLAMLDSTIVGTALPKIVGELGGTSLYTWSVTAYLLSSTVTVPIYGRLSDVYGRKPLLVVGMSLFLGGSVLCAAAQDMGQLIAFRGIQGLGAGALLPLSLALASDLIPRERMGRMQGSVGALMGTAMIGGPYLGGVLTDHVGWHWIFLINVPLGVFILGVILWRLPRSRRDRSVKVRIDYLGIALFALAISALLIGLTQKSATEGGTALPREWTDLPVAGPLAAAVVLLAAFVLVERKVAEPLIPLGMFKDRAYTTFNVTSFFTAFAMFAGTVFLPRFFQGIHHVSATGSGLRVYPMMVGMVAGSVLASLLISKTGRYKLLLVLAAASMLTGTVLFGRLTENTSALSIGIWMALIGLGIGPMLSGLTIAVQATVAPEHIGLATGKLTFFRSVGASLALAIAGTAFSQQLTERAPADGLTAATASATGTVLLWVGGIGAAITLLALLLAPNRRLRTGR